MPWATNYTSSVQGTAPKRHFITNKDDALVAMNNVFSKAYIESIWGTNRFDDALDYWMALNAFSYVVN